MSVKNKLSQEQNHAIELMNRSDGGALTLDQISGEVGVSVRTLSRWKNDKDFAEGLLDYAEKEQRAFLAETYSRLRGMINNPKIADNNRLKAIELMLRNQGRLKGVKEISVTTDRRTIEDMLADVDIFVESE